MGSKEEEESEQLGDPNYWDSRYASSDGKRPTHEWFRTFSALDSFFQSHLLNSYSRYARILHLGSGDSTIPRHLLECGYENQLCVDFSPIVVQLMSARDGPEIGWKQADVRNLDFVPDGSTDVAFDKGTLDAMIYGSPWDPPDEVRENTSRYIDEVRLKWLIESRGYN